MGEVDNSVKHMQQALRADPDNADARKELKRYKHIGDNIFTFVSSIILNRMNQRKQKRKAIPLLKSGATMMQSKAGPAALIYATRVPSCCRSSIAIGQMLWRKSSVMYDMQGSIYLFPYS